VASGRGETTSAIRDKKARTLRAALDTLDDAGLMHLPGAAAKRRRYEGLTLLDEAGWQITGDPLPSAVPAMNAATHIRRRAELSTFAR
jgi:hypothetical protein